MVTSAVNSLPASLRPLQRQPEMSSTLFARGVTTQVGQRRRHEVLEKNIAELQAALALVKDLPNQVRILEARNAVLERRVISLEAARDQATASASPESPSA